MIQPEMDGGSGDARQRRGLRHRRTGAGIAFGGTAALVMGFVGFQAAASDATDVVPVRSDHSVTGRKARVATADLRTADGTTVGSVSFKRKGEFTRVVAKLWPGYAVGAVDAFHGFHIHANTNPGNGDGCVADPAQPSSTWFVSADGHFAEPGQTHAHHTGDLPSLLINPDGSAQAEFVTARFRVTDLANKVVILHAASRSKSSRRSFVFRIGERIRFGHGVAAAVRCHSHL